MLAWSHERADDAEVGLKARRERHDGLLADECCQLALELCVQRQRAV